MSHAQISEPRKSRCCIFQWDYICIFGRGTSLGFYSSYYMAMLYGLVTEDIASGQLRLSPGTWCWFTMQISEGPKGLMLIAVFVKCLFDQKYLSNSKPATHKIITSWWFHSFQSPSLERIPSPNMFGPLYCMRPNKIMLIRRLTDELHVFLEQITGKCTSYYSLVIM